MKIDFQKSATEFVVIVVGVLAALGVDQWVDYRNDREAELEYIERLRVDLSADIQSFNSLEGIFETKARIIGELRDQTVAELLSYDPAELMQDMVYSGFTSFPTNQSATYDELISTGRLSLVQNVALIDALSHYYRRYEQISRILFEPIGEYRHLLYEAIPGEIAYAWRLSRKIPDLEDLRAGLDKLKSSPELDSAANVEIRYASSIIFYLRQFREEAEGLLTLLDQEI